MSSWFGLSQEAGVASGGTTFAYDGSLPGLLCALREALRQNAETPEFTMEAAVQGDLWHGVFRVPPDEETAEAFLRQIEAAASRVVVRHILHAVSAEQPGLANALYPFVRLSLIHGAAVCDYLTHPAVSQTLKTARAVAREIHRYHGLLRFQETQHGFYYAPMVPSANVAITVAGHFVTRLRGERWIIHDVRRNLCAVWNGRSLEAGEATVALRVRADVAAPEPGVPDLSAREIQHQALWRAYFGAIAIPERHNPQLQRKCMPKRYWKYLVEVPQPGSANDRQSGQDL
jgi:probable DNA metabolism protein